MPGVLWPSLPRTMRPAPMARAICSAKALTAEFEPCEQTICNGMFNVGSHVVQRAWPAYPSGRTLRFPQATRACSPVPRDVRNAASIESLALRMRRAYAVLTAGCRQYEHTQSVPPPLSGRGVLRL